MRLYRRRNRGDEKGTFPDGKLTFPLRKQEQELVLKMKKNELFNPHVLLPHAELNEIVYKSVNTFVEKYRGGDMTLTILTEPVNESVQNTFREVYRAHYRDEYDKVSRYLMRRFSRSLVLVILSLTAFLVGNNLTSFFAVHGVFLNVVINLGAFCLWEVGYTQFAARDAFEEKKRIERAIHAEIEFY
jgi:hypothetical protein